jgi:hypothetical protein
MLRLTGLAVVAVLVVSAPIRAQRSVPPASPTIGASAGFGAGIAMPVGRIADTHTAGYALTGLVDFSAADQPYSFRTELIYQHFDHKTTGAGATLKNKNVGSINASLLIRTPRRQASAYFLGGIGVYNATEEGTKPGLNIGAGLEVPLTFFVGIADVRMHFVLSEGRKLITIPIILGARF